MFDYEKENIVNIEEWIEKAKKDPVKYLERQVTDIFLKTLSSTNPYCNKFFLKGGALMGIAYNSPRQTGDIDYSTTLEPHHETCNQLKDDLNQALPIVAKQKGYLDITCQVQKVEFMPKNFNTAQYPAFRLKVGYAKVGSTQEIRLKNGRASSILEVDISFKEPIGGIQILTIKDKNSITSVPAYSLGGMIAEKYRALLQQEIRNRYRRQDVYDLNMLIKKFSFNSEELQEIKRLLLEKCQARNIFPKQDSLQQPEIKERAEKDWKTLKLELEELPNFSECFDTVNSFYHKLMI